jgi:hypothetical protein
LLLFDFPSRRMLCIAPNGMLAGTVPVDMTITDTLLGEEEYVGRSTMLSAEVELWVTRAVANDATAAIADVFDASGSVVRRVSFPATHRVAGFGKGTVYLVRTDDDGLQWLGRFKR